MSIQYLITRPVALELSPSTVMWLWF